MRLNIVMKFVLAVGIPLLVIYTIISLAQFNSMRTMASTDGSLRTQLSVQKVADYLDDRLATIGTITRSIAVFAELDQRAARKSQAELLTHLLETDTLVYGAVMAWGDPATGPLEGWRIRRDAGTFESTALDPEEGERVLLRYQANAAIADNWSKPWATSQDGTQLSAYFHPIVVDNRTIGLVTVAIRLRDLQEEAARELKATSKFAIVNSQWDIMSTEDPADIGKPLSVLVSTPDLPTIQKLREIVTSRFAQGELSSSTRMPSYLMGEDYWVAWAILDETGWLLLNSVSESIILQPVYSLLQRDIIIGVAGLVIIVMAIVVIGLFLTRRIRRLDSAIDQVREGDLSIRVEPGGGHDEMARLCRGFNQMVGAFAENLDALASAEADRLSVERELNIARDIQQSLQPRVPPHFDRPVDMECAAVNLPARHVAGDFFDYWALDKDHMAFLLGDVSGKGVPAAIFMAVARTTIRMTASHMRDPARILDQVNRQLREENEQGLFITLFLGVCHVQTGELHYANAGHHPGILKPADGSPRPVAPATGTILGTLEEATWTTETLHLDPGDHFILFTDGLSEAPGENGEMLEMSGILELLETCDCSNAEIVSHHLAAVAETRQEGHLFDDVTVLDVHRLVGSNRDAASEQSSEPVGTA